MNNNVTYHPDELPTIPSIILEEDIEDPKFEKSVTWHGVSSFMSGDKSDQPRWIVEPWSRPYKCWWGFIVFLSCFTLFFETYMISFPVEFISIYKDGSATLEYGLMFMFLVDMGITFNLAYIDEEGTIVYDRRRISKSYLRRYFWIDLIGLFPFYLFTLACTGALGDETSSKTAEYLALLRLLRLVRVYRVAQLFAMLQYSTKISLLTLTLIRNFGFSLVWTHCSACVMFFVAREYSFDQEDTWIGSDAIRLTGTQRYLTSMHWSVVTFTTVGYGDFSPVNSAEQIWGMLYMLINMVVQAWVIGSISLLIIKDDEATGEYRDKLRILSDYSREHSFDRRYHKRLKSYLKMEFQHGDLDDERVLEHFPSSVRRKVLRKLYLPTLLKTSLMQGLRQQFINAFLTACDIETFSPGEEILHRGNVASDLYLLMEGSVKLTKSNDGIVDKSSSMRSGSMTESELHVSRVGSGRSIQAGEFINAIGFFTDTPQADTIRTETICKMLTLSRSSYKEITVDHPSCSCKILQNLLHKVQEIFAERKSTDSQFHHSDRFAKIQVDSVHEHYGSISERENEVDYAVTTVQTETALASIKDLIRLHINKQKDSHTMLFLFAASRGDVKTIRYMCDQGFNPDSADYDSRTALMVAAVKGNTDVVKVLLEYECDPNLSDIHGTSALLEATKHGHEDTVDVLLLYRAVLGLKESQAASSLCQCVFDGDIVSLRRLLKAKIDTSASDYDKRAAIHIAACEGNVKAIEMLVLFGADVNLKDRWGNTPYDEAVRCNATNVVEYLKSTSR